MACVLYCCTRRKSTVPSTLRICYGSKLKNKLQFPFFHCERTCKRFSGRGSVEKNCYFVYSPLGRDWSISRNSLSPSKLFYFWSWNFKVKKKIQSYKRRAVSSQTLRLRLHPVARLEVRNFLNVFKGTSDENLFCSDLETSTVDNCVGKISVQIPNKFAQKWLKSKIKFPRLNIYLHTAVKQLE